MDLPIYLKLQLLPCFRLTFCTMGGSKKCETSSAASLCSAPEVFEVEKGNSST